MNNEPLGLTQNQKPKKAKNPKKKLIKELTTEVRMAMALGKLTLRIIVDFSVKLVMPRSVASAK